jgi:putative hydrolase of the HAD superfamily
MVKAVIFDYIGTLVNCSSYSMDLSREKLYNAIVDAGFNVERKQFLSAYIKAHEKYRQIRYGELREVTNAVWVAEALADLGFNVSIDDARLRAALNVFFKDYIDTLKLRYGAKQLLKRVHDSCKVGLVSNFTHAPVVYNSQRKLGISEFFHVTVVSEANGYRKPSEKIFNEVLNALMIKPEDAVYIGDSPLEDIGGAKTLGFKTIFVESQFYKLSDLENSNQKPDFTASNLMQVQKLLDALLSAR